MHPNKAGLFSVMAISFFASCGAPDDEIVMVSSELAQEQLGRFEATTPHRVHGQATASPTGLSPAQIKAVYNLPSIGGSGTIAIIDAYDYPTAENDLNVFSSKFGLLVCTTANGCFEKHKMSNKLRADSGWSLEAALDVQWAHAVAPNAKVLLVEAKSSSGTDLLAAVDYARNRADVVAVSMSWGGGEFSGEGLYDSRFTSQYGAAFFAASGDNGTGTIWPSVSPNVVGVGGTSLLFNLDGTLANETAWSGSGGGVSAYESEPSYQVNYGLVNSGGKRAVPDVSYDADPASGFSVYDTTSYYGQKGWFQVGGTSAGTPQWAAIQALGLSSSNNHFYADAAGASYASYFRDVTRGTNGACGVNCSAAPGYDLVTGLGSPLTTTY